MTDVLHTATINAIEVIVSSDRLVKISVICYSLNVLPQMMTAPGQIYTPTFASTLIPLCATPI